MLAAVIGCSNAANGKACTACCVADFAIAEIEISLQGLCVQGFPCRWTDATDSASAVCEYPDMSMFDISMSAGTSEVTGTSNSQPE